MKNISIFSKDRLKRQCASQVYPSSEESEESQKEEAESNTETNFISFDENSRTLKTKASHRISLKLQREENQAKELDNLTSSQLEAIIGGSLSG